tara:strand:+ start:1358 stop:1798 length:441 start_codon:yes stop_codon:yes gene_type:complete
MTFSVEFDAIAKKTNQKVEDVARIVATDIFERVIYGTPSGKPELWQSNPPKGYVAGQLKGNWQATIGSPSKKILSVKDKDGSLTVKNMKSVMKSWDGTGVVYFRNNLPYAARIEYGAHSKQAPQGMVRLALITLNQAIKKSIQKVA